MDIFPQGELPALQHLTVSSEEPAGWRPRDSSDPAFGAATHGCRNVLLRELLIADIKAELLDAIKSIAAIKPPVVSPNFEFWRRHHSELLVDLAPLIEDVWCLRFMPLPNRLDCTLLFEIKGDDARGQYGTLCRQRAGFSAGIQVGFGC